MNMYIYVNTLTLTNCPEHCQLWHNYAGSLVR